MGIKDEAQGRAQHAQDKLRQSADEARQRGQDQQDRLRERREQQNRQQSFDDLGDDAYDDRT
ncbi:hypothetical protein E2C00_32685 [Streptomyces sp. WAC05374]|uniref:hypothetical protein n=1 Tax=Streptomyces sp. WAC05374 TaxID=2487420 RepID=UPI000F87D549|nr:hypothetical protein [Streptomyces sp. WAC05374]RST19052.1 hypothetical protein EF905_02740 [Streptomyces sp. WAC05374]TDF36980.1 hypothetical protein E2B92_30335 [Streptomyces sp. WAC05374]TDF46475.1 hypothetical protein E2C02_31980 [Streptomyces sp. WAC05374]TDF47576.1 hypothetical protein E2C00_32685 [Streptomyces sp. WAC05374]